MIKTMYSKEVPNEKYFSIFFNSRFTTSLVYYGLSLNTSTQGGNDYVNFLISGAIVKIYPIIY